MKTEKEVIRDKTAFANKCCEVYLSVKIRSTINSIKSIAATIQRRCAMRYRVRRRKVSLNESSLYSFCLSTASLDLKLLIV